jgi:hypothetical protein
MNRLRLHAVRGRPATVWQLARAGAYLGADGQFAASEAYNPCPERHGAAGYGVLLVRTRTRHYWWQ